MEMKLLTPFQRWLDALPTTNLKLFSGVALMIGLVLFDMLLVAVALSFYLWAGWHGKVLDLREPPLISELIYSAHAAVLGFLGIGYMQFGKKRDTYASPSPDSERADVPAKPAPTTAAEPKADAAPAAAVAVPARSAAGITVQHDPGA